MFLNYVFITDTFNKPTTVMLSGVKVYFVAFIVFQLESDQVRATFRIFNRH